MIPWDGFLEVGLLGQRAQIFFRLRFRLPHRFPGSSCQFTLPPAERENCQSWSTPRAGILFGWVRSELVALWQSLYTRSKSSGFSRQRGGVCRSEGWGWWCGSAQVQIPAFLLTSQLPANIPGKVVDNGPSAWSPLPPVWETPVKFQTPGFGWAQPRLLCPLGSEPTVG